MHIKFYKLGKLLPFNQSDLKIHIFKYCIKSLLVSGTIERGEFLFKKANGYWQIHESLLPHFQGKNKLEK